MPRGKSRQFGGEYTNMRPLLRFVDHMNISIWRGTFQSEIYRIAPPSDHLVRDDGRSKISYQVHPRVIYLSYARPRKVAFNQYPCLSWSPPLCPRAEIERERRNQVRWRRRCSSTLESFLFADRVVFLPSDKRAIAGVSPSPLFPPGTGPETIAREEVLTSLGSFACPICFYPLKSTSGLASSKEGRTICNTGMFSTSISFLVHNSFSKAGSVCCRDSSNVANFECNTCRKSYNRKGAYLDFTVSSGSEKFAESVPASTELFRSPLISYLYERGWRQNFVLGGFPGPEKEFEMAKVYLKPTFGGTIIDASCGSGLFSRMFCTSGLYNLVVALDFSENMLRQCDNFIEQEGISRNNIIIVRADISRLPFASSSVDAVHAGAALHCWPSPSAAVAEVSRVLHPGGSFVATTFIADGVYSAIPFLRLLRQALHGVTGQRVFLSEGEMEDLCRTCGLVGFTCVRNGPFIMISASKPC